MRKVVRHVEIEMQARENLAYRFYKLILEPDEYPDSVLDDESVSQVCYALWNKYNGNYEEYLVTKISKLYVVDLNEDFLYMEFWQFLDYLEEEQERQKNQKLLPKPE